MNNVEIGQKIKKCRENLNMSLEDIAILVGVNKSTIQRYETAKITSIKLPVIQAIAEALNVDPAWIVGKSNIKKPYKKNINLYDIPNIKDVQMKKIPLLGEIACGEPIYASEDLDCFVEINDDVKVDFALICIGDSMINARINDGDIVFIRNQPIVNNGDIACVLVDDEATLKRVYMDKDSITLVAENSNFPPKTYTKNDFEQIKILGKAIAFQSHF